ncbi:FRG domain-containing protein [Maribacter sp. 2210JD10-5]|uniref:FRG domain-containing protein n=1 Tax=Maribacter sp. 2210JD10-5 TaxID=3386272 RepID=UPI0039BCC4A5
MSEMHRVNNLEEAMNLAKKFSDSGKYNLFRGQAQNWNVTPSSARLNQNEFEEGIEKLKRLYSFFETSENLLKYQSNIDWFFAVAQHYGLPTNYIDFTTNYRVSAYFATNSNSNEIGKESVIICLNETDFADFIKHTQSIYLNDKVIAPYISKIDVHNLWRLQSQEGLFLFTPYSNIESYYNFDRIIFPYEKPYKGITKNLIYPENKSELEIHLDYYFNREERLIGQKRFRKFADEMKMPGFTMPDLKIDNFLRNKKEHKSWESEHFSKWSYAFLENWKTLESESVINLKLPIDSNSYQEFSDTSMLSFNDLDKDVKRNQNLKFVIDLNGNTKSFKDLAKRIENSCVRIWDGTRNLPFTNFDIYKIIIDYIFFEYYEHISEKAFSYGDRELIVLELTNKHHSMTRCYVTKSKLEEAFREDIKDVLIEDYEQDITSLVLLKVNIPQIIFDFEKLLALFKEEMIAYQVVYNSEKINPVIFYSPTELNILGYS